MSQGNQQRPPASRITLTETVLTVLPSTLFYQHTLFAGRFSDATTQRNCEK